MTESPRPRRFQIHLSTAIVMMFAAGGLIWSNTIATIKQELKFEMDMEQYREARKNGYLAHVYRDILITEISYGWPCVAIIYSERSGTRATMIYLVFNTCVALTIIFATWFLCEWAIRRGSERKLRSSRKIIA